MDATQLLAALSARKGAIEALWLTVAQRHGLTSPQYEVMKAAYAAICRRYYRAYVNLRD